MIATARLTLRPWLDADRDAFVAMCADPEVMADYGAPHSPEESAAKLARYQAAVETLGFGRWVVERREDGAFLGYVGVMPIPQDLALAPGFEIGWRLIRAAWGQGYAPEAARAGLADVFGRIGLREVLSYTGAANHRSEAVMRRAGMTRAPQLDFDYPGPYGRFIVYRSRA